MSLNQKKKGFSLAETCMVLGLIGILAVTMLSLNKFDTQNPQIATTKLSETDNSLRAWAKAQVGANETGLGVADINGQQDLNNKIVEYFNNKGNKDVQGNVQIASTGESVSGGTVFTLSNDVELYAKYTLDSYQLEFYDGANKLGLNPTTYNVYDNLNLPTYNKEGYLFEGWYDNSLFEGNPIEKIEVGSTGNKKFYAKTEEILGYDITYNFNGGNTKYASFETMINAFIAAYASYYGKDGVTKSNWSDKLEAVCNDSSWHYDDFFKANPEWNWFLTFYSNLTQTSSWGYDITNKYIQTY